MPSAMPKATWQLLPAPPDQVGSLARSLALPQWAARVLWLRGLRQPGPAREFLDPRLEHLPRPEGLLGLEAALEVLVPAVEQGVTVGVAGDYDADGVTATALMVEFLEQVGVPVVWDIPHRLHDGYGFSPASARRLARKGARLVITVDSGISDHQGLAAARDLGLEVVVTDHHQIPPGPLVPARAVINPQQEGCRLPAHLAGVGVAFYLAAGLRAALRERGFFRSRPEPNLRRSLDLVALGTCADVVPLVGCNRVLVRQGLAVMNQAPRPGLAALARVAGLSRGMDSRDLSFGLAPRVNAPGRLDHAGPALELMLSAGPDQALPLAQTLDQLNRRRQEVGREMFEQALEMVGEDQDLGERPCLVLARPQWHRGVLGIVASRLVEKFRRPTLLLSLENGSAYGSGRSLPGFHLQQALSRLESLLSSYGGHALAAGLSLPSRHLDQLAQGLCQAAQEHLSKWRQPPVLELDALVKPEQLAGQALPLLESLAPFGEGNPPPRLGLQGVKVKRAWIVAQKHLKLELEGAGAQAIGFNLAHLLPRPGDRLDLACTPRISNFQGRHLELIVEDLRVCGKPS